ncbi:hypothetical protein M0R45_024401 [Rubus argutus]|uniref:Uncharacterized protein n=1 Tax=Rubus argutus TaxID=59490 RepID=A0AAW1WT20_RUBAR
MGESSDDSIQDLGFKMQNMMGNVEQPEQPRSFIVRYPKDGLCEGLDESWYIEVLPAFEKYGLSCTWNEDIRRMTVFETEYTGDPDMIFKGRLALIVLAAGQTTKWVEWILSGRVHCDVIYIAKPDGMFRQDFTSKYEEFIDKFDNIYELHKKLNCLVLYLGTSIIVLANTFEDTSKVRCQLVEESLLSMQHSF